MSKLFLRLFVLAALAAAGCMSGSTGDVSGKVVYKAQPVGGAVVNLMMREKGVGATATLDANGVFKVAEPMDVGTYAVFVTAAPPVAGPPGSKPPAMVPLKVPKKFTDAITTDALVTVKSGSNDLTIEFKD